MKLVLWILLVLAGVFNLGSLGGWRAGIGAVCVVGAIFWLLFWLLEVYMRGGSRPNNL